MLVDRQSLGSRNGDPHRELAAGFERGTLARDAGPLTTVLLCAGRRVIGDVEVYAWQNLRRLFGSRLMIGVTASGISDWVLNCNKAALKTAICPHSLL